MRQTRWRIAVWTVVVCGLAAGCRGGRAENPKATACFASGARELVPIGTQDVGGAVQLARWNARVVALVADEDTRSVRVVDLDSKQVVTTHELAGRPSQLVVLSDGRLVVADRDRSEISVLEASGGALATRCMRRVPAEPVALAVTPDQAGLLVSSAWGHALTALRTRDLGEEYRVNLPRDPRAVAVTSNGRIAFVAHAVGGRASAVDLESRSVRYMPLGEHKLIPAPSLPVRTDSEVPVPELKQRVRTACQGFALAKSFQPVGRVLAPQVLVDPGDLTRRVEGYGDGAGRSEVPSVVVMDETTGEPVPASLTVAFEFPSPDDAMRSPEPECLLPRAAIVDPATQTLLVACLGTDQVVGYDAASASPASAVKRRWSVASGPTGIALDPERRRALVWSQFERSLTFVPLDFTEEDLLRAPPKLASIQLPEAGAPSREVALGRILFHTVSDLRISRDGRACASCHPDGRDDGLVWATPNGPRRSMMLAGRLGDTAPFSWDGAHVDIEDHLHATFERLRGSGGLSRYETEALVTYLKSLPAPPAPSVTDGALVERGREVFASANAGCARCHAGTAGTDQTRHDVASKSGVDRSARFDTPSLRFVSGRGPWFHHGKFSTLRELLVATDGAMGHTKHLSPEDLAALEAFLETL